MGNIFLYRTLFSFCNVASFSFCMFVCLYSQLMQIYSFGQTLLFCCISRISKRKLFRATFIQNTPALLRLGRYCQKKKVHIGTIVQLSRDLMDWVSQRLCFAFDDTDRFVSWTSVYSLIQRTCLNKIFISVRITHVYNK